jgi:hypothetical protein
MDARLSLTPEATIAEPLGDAEGQQQTAKGNTGQGDDEGEPPCVGASAGRRKAAKQRYQQHAGQYARAQDAGATLKQLSGAVVGLSHPGSG